MERSRRGKRQRDMDLPLTVLEPRMAPANHVEEVLVNHVELSFEAFYRAERTSIARALSLALGDVDLAVDATDEALTRAYERWPSVSQCDRPAAWVYRVGMNWALSILRRRRRSNHRLYDSSVVDLSIGDPAIHEALAALDVKHRSVIVCRHLLGWSIPDIAVALNTREGTVKSRIHRANKALQARLHHLRPEEQQ